MDFESLKQRKHFYRNALRRTLSLLIISLLINGLLAWVIYNKITHPGKISYYSTSGVKAPIKLTALSTPNYSSTPLLADDPPSNKKEDLVNG